MESRPDPPTRGQGIALFDLDGTLLAWDCQLLFRDYVVRRHPWRRVFLVLFLAFAPLAPWLGSDRMKRVFLAFLWKMPAERREALFHGFAESVMPLIYPELRERLEKHREAGDFLILASASPEGYVREIGRLLGFDMSLGTEVGYGPLFPFVRNHKGMAKVDRLRKVLPAHCWSGDRLEGSHGFSDSTADLPMLAICQAATVVNPKAALERRAKECGWHIVHPARPWRSRADRAKRSLCLLLGIGSDPAGRTLKAGG